MYLSKITKCISVALCALLLCTLMPSERTEAAASTSSGFSVNVSATSGKAGEQIVVPVNLANVPAAGISTADMSITYDATKLEYVSGAAGSIVTNAATNFAINKEKDGLLKALFLDYTMSNGYISTSGVFTNLTFKVLSSASSSTTVNVTSATFGDKNLSSLSATISAGTIALNGGGTVSTPTVTTVPTPANTTVSTGFTVNVLSTSGKPGEQITVPLSFASVPANGISTADMTITYDSTKLEYVSGTAGSIVTNAATDFAINKESNGKIKILFLDYTMNTGYIRQSGVFANLTFKVISSTSSSTTVNVTSATFGDKNLTGIAAKINAGTITISGGTTAPTPTVSTPTKTPTITTPATATPTIPVSSGFTVSVSSASGNYGAQIVVPVNFANVPASGISTSDMTITYDSTRLEYVSGAAGSIVTNAGTNFAINKESNGKLKILFLDYTMDTEYIRQSGVFANITFKVLTSSAVSTNVSVINSTFGDKNLNGISAKFNEGTIALNGGGTVATPVPVTPTALVTPTPIKTNTPSGFTVYVDSVSGKSGDQIVVPVNFVNVPASGISTADMAITYDATKLEYVSGAAGSIVTNAGTNYAINKESNGKLKVLFLDYTMATEYISKSGVFTNLTFKVITSSAVSTNVSIINSTFGDKDLNGISAKLNAGTIALNGGGTVATPTPVTTNTPSVFTVYINQAVTGKYGEQIIVPVSFLNVPSTGISTADMTVIYDATKLEYVSGEAGSIVTNAGTNYAINKESNGKIKVLFLDYTMATEYISKSGVFTNLTFKVITTSAVSTNVSLSSATFGDKDLNKLSPAFTTAGAISLNGGGTTPTPTPTSTPVTTQPPSQSGDYSVSYTQNAWGTGATVNLTIKNNGSTAANGWTVNFNFAGNQKITNSWNCGFTQNGNAVSITNASYNSDIPAGGSVTVGFNISYSGTNSQPTNFVVNAASSGGSTPTTPPTQNTNCSASYTQNAWGTGATVNITIKNNGSTEVNGWTVNFNYAGNQKITNAWNCDYSQNGNAVTLKNSNYNGTIPAGGTLTIGFNISYSGTNTIPTSITVK